VLRIKESLNFRKPVLAKKILGANMANSHDPFGASNVFVSFPQHTIEALGRLQAHTTDTVPSSVYIYDLVEQRILCASASVATMLGYTADSIDAMGPSGLANLIHPDDLNRVSEHYQRFSTLLPGEIIALEYRMKRADGVWCCLRSQETPCLQAIDGFPRQILGLIQDLTQHSPAKPAKSARSTQSFVSSFARREAI
jgi:PAS domain S-box-containing protein